MFVVVALLYLTIVVFLGTSIAIVVLPMFVGSALLYMADNVCKHVPVLWQVYTAVTAMRGTIMIALNQLVGEPMDLGGLCHEYLVITVFAVGWWIIRNFHGIALRYRT